MRRLGSGRFDSGFGAWEIFLQTSSVWNFSAYKFKCQVDSRYVSGAQKPYKTWCSVGIFTTMDLDETIKEETRDRRGEKRRRWKRRRSWGRHKAETWDTPRLSGGEEEPWRDKEKPGDKRVTGRHWYHETLEVTCQEGGSEPLLAALPWVPLTGTSLPLGMWKKMLQLTEKGWRDDGAAHWNHKPKFGKRYEARTRIPAIIIWGAWRFGLHS